MIESTINIDKTEVYIQARFPNARTRPKQPEPEIIGLDNRTRRRGSVSNSYNTYELYLFTDPITKSGNERTYMSKPEALIISFSSLELYNKTIKEINSRIYGSN